MPAPRCTLNLMKYLISILLTINALFVSNAQIHELGFFLGGSNTIGDIGGSKFINANSPALGVVYKWNITTRYAIRAGFTHSNLKSYDFYAQELNRFNRFFTVDNNVFEFSAGFEVNFFEFNLHDDEKEFTPYLFTGINYFQQQLFAVDRARLDPNVKYDSERIISIPAIFGVKASISPLFILGFEVGVRYALSDNIDGSNPIGQYENDPYYKHGNLYNNDWYVFTGFTFSYTFGRLPCYCKE
jgi:hypothetical protein